MKRRRLLAERCHRGLELGQPSEGHSGTSQRNAARPDLVTILLTGIPQSVLASNGLAGAVPRTNVGGQAMAEMLRLNVAQPPTPTDDAGFSIFGYLGGDGAGSPNGRRVYDDVATIELRAVAGATLRLVAHYTPDAAVGTVGTDPRRVISFGLTAGSAGAPASSRAAATTTSAPWAPRSTCLRSSTWALRTAAAPRRL